MVVVVGAGFAGRMAAIRIRRAGLPVTLIDPLPGAVERTRLHQLAVADLGVTWPVEELARRIGAEHVVGWVVRVEADRVLLADGRTVRFDQLVVATGSVSDDLGVPGVREHAHTLDGVDQALALRAKVATLGGDEPVVVVGAGLTGLELATELAERRRGVVLVGALTGWSPRGKRIVRDALAELGIEHHDTLVTAVDPRGVETAAGRLDAGAVVWTGGMRASPWLRDSGLPVDPRGRLRVDEALRVVGRPAVVAAGDCAATDLRMACATAIPMGCHAASVVGDTVAGRSPAPFRFAFALRCVSLGRRRAIVQGVDAVDRPTWALGGRPATVTKELILWTVARLPGWEAGAGVPLYGWPKGERALVPVEVA